MTTYYHAQENKYVTVGEPFTVGGTQHGSNWMESSSPEAIAALGFVPLVTVETVPEDYRWYNRSEQRVGAECIVTWTRFPDEQIAEMERAQKLSEIDRLEREAMVPRVVREFMLAEAERRAIEAGHTIDELRAGHFGYRKTKELDEQIAALRGSL